MSEETSSNEEIKSSEETPIEEKKVEETVSEVKADSENKTVESKVESKVASEGAAKPAERPAPTAGARPTGGRPTGRPTTGGRPGYQGGGARRYNNDNKSNRFRRRVCRFCYEKDAVLDYNKPEILERFITDRGKILPRRVTGTCSKHQRHLARSIKRARFLAYLPYLEK